MLSVRDATYVLHRVTDISQVVINPVYLHDVNQNAVQYEVSWV